MAMIEVSNLYHSYTNDDVYAVQDVSFTIDKGEIVGFLGPSGAGKSTTQGVLSGLLQLQKGDIVIDGEKRNGRPDKAFFNRIGVGFERPNVYKKLSEVKTLKLERFEFPSNLWAETLSDFAVAYKRAEHDRDKIMDTLIPLYYGRTCSFVVALEPLNIQQAEEVIEDQCLVFESSKPGLLARWFE